MTLFPWLRLVRAGTLFSPAADVVAGLCLAGQPWSWHAAAAVLASTCTYAGGMVLNDHADRGEDAIQRPERPLPRGDIRPNSALTLGLALLGVAVLLSPRPAWHAMLGSLVLLYDYLLKAFPLTATLNMATLRGLNLLTGAAVFGLEPTRDHLIAALVYALYIGCVTILGRYEDEKRVKPRAVLAIQLVPPLAAFLVLLALPVRWPAIVGGIAAAAFVVRARGVGVWDRSAIRGSMTWLLLGTMGYTGLLALGTGRTVEGLAILLAILPARWIARRISLT